MFVKSDTIKSGSDLHKSPKLLPLKEKNFFPHFLLISMWNIVFKREQIETRLQEEVLISPNPANQEVNLTLSPTSR